MHLRTRVAPRRVVARRGQRLLDQRAARAKRFGRRRGAQTTLPVTTRDEELHRRAGAPQPAERRQGGKGSWSSLAADDRDGKHVGVPIGGALQANSAWERPKTGDVRAQR